MATIPSDYDDRKMRIFCPTSQEISQEAHFALFIDQRLVNNLNPNESRIHYVSKKILQGCSVGLASIGRYPFVAINMKLAGPHKALGGVLSYGNCTSFAILISWAMLHLINDHVSLQCVNERALLKSNRNRCCSCDPLILPTSIVLGVLSQLPFAYLAYVYNDNNLAMAAIMMASDSWVPSYSAHQGIKRIAEQRSFNKFEKELVVVKNKILSLVEKNRNIFATMQSGQTSFIQAFENLKQVELGNDRAIECFKLLTQDNETSITESGLTTKVSQGMISLYGYLAAGCNLGTLGFVGYKGMELLSDQVGLNVVIASLAVGANLYVNGLSPRTAVRIFNMVADVFSSRYQPSLSDQLRPKLSLVLKILGLTTAALSIGPSIQIGHDYFDERSRIFMETMISSAVIFLISTATLDIIDEVVEEYIIKKGTEEERMIISINHKVKHFQKVLSKSALVELGKFLKFLPNEVVNNLIEHTEVTTEKLGDYLEGYSPSIPLERS